MPRHTMAYIIAICLQSEIILENRGDRDVHHCTPLYTIDCHLSADCLQNIFTLVTAMYTIVHHCTPLYTIVHHCTSLHTDDYQLSPEMYSFWKTMMTAMYIIVRHCTPLITNCLQSENILGKNCVTFYIASITSIYHELILKQTIASVLNAIDFNVVFVVKSYAPSTTTIAAYVGIE